MFSFKTIMPGGVHPDGHKDATATRPILTQVPLPPRLYLPLGQQAGEQSRPLVKAGEKVLKGQRIAISGGSLSSNIHAPTSGTVLSIEDITAPHPSGLPTRAIVIESDGEDRWIELTELPNPRDFSPEELATKVEEAGIVGMGGAIFPAAVKLRQGRRYEIKTLLVNGGECEPYLTTDDRLMRERAEAIVEGALLARYIIEAYRVVIGIEDNKPEAIAAMRQAAAPHGMIEVAVVPSRYPMGSAKQLIQAVTGLEVPAGGRSNDVGVLVHNVATIYAIQQALRFGRPLISRVLTVGGDCVGKPQNVEALIGTPLSHIVDTCGGITGKPARLLMGGPMMGQALPTLDVPLLKGCSGVLALSQKEVNAEAPSPCIRCSRCVSACPMGLVPLEMAKFARVDNFEQAQEYGLRDCILCGSCSYVCPSHIPLVQYFEYAKGELYERSAGQKKMEYTVRLTNERNERLEREAAAKAAAKSQKKAKRGSAEAAAASPESVTETNTETAE